MGRRKRAGAMRTGRGKISTERAPSNARSVAIAADRTEGDIEGVGEDSGESEGRAAGVGDGRVERGIGKRRRYWPGGGRDILLVILICVAQFQDSCQVSTSKVEKKREDRENVY